MSLSDFTTVEWATLAAPIIASAVVLIVARVRGYSFAGDIGLRLPTGGSTLLWSLIWLGVAIAGEYVARLQGESQPASWWAQFSRDQIIVRAIQIIVLYPIAEELVFRGLLFHALEKRAGWVLAVLGSATLFTIGHFDRDPLGLLQTFVDGTLYAVVRRGSGSLLLPIGLHMTGNAFAVFQRLGFG